MAPWRNLEPGSLSPSMKSDYPRCKRPMPKRLRHLEPCTYLVLFYAPKHLSNVFILSRMYSRYHVEECFSSARCWLCSWCRWGVQIWHRGEIGIQICDNPCRAIAPTLGMNGKLASRNLAMLFGGFNCTHMRLLSVHAANEKSTHCPQLPRKVPDSYSRVLPQGMTNLGSTHSKTLSTQRYSAPSRQDSSQHWWKRERYAYICMSAEGGCPVKGVINKHVRMYAWYASAAGGTNCIPTISNICTESNIQLPLSSKRIHALTAAPCCYEP